MGAPPTVVHPRHRHHPRSNTAVWFASCIRVIRVLLSALPRAVLPSAQNSGRCGLSAAMIAMPSTSISQPGRQTGATTTSMGAVAKRSRICRRAISQSVWSRT